MINISIVKNDEAKKIFVDTSGWYAAIVSKDSDHKAAQEFLHLEDSVSNKSPKVF